MHLTISSARRIGDYVDKTHLAHYGTRLQVDGGSDPLQRDVIHECQRNRASYLGSI